MKRTNLTQEEMEKLVRGAEEVAKRHGIPPKRKGVKKIFFGKAKVMTKMSGLVTT